jgi:AcrR family transcriptional regulator
MIAAAKLFRTRGFSAVTVDEIGAAVGVTGPALYRHFTSKEDILISTLSAAGNRMEADARELTRSAASPKEALRAIVRSYLAEVIPNRLMVGVYLQGTAFPADSAVGEPLRQRQHKYLRHVTGVLRTARPELSASQARTLVHATYGVLNSVAWAGDVDRFAADLLESAAMATLFSGTPNTSTRSANAAKRTRMKATA